MSTSSAPRPLSVLEVLQRFVRESPTSIAAFDRGMRYVAASEGWVRLYADPHADVTGRLHYEVVPTIPERWKAMHRRALAGERFEALEDSFALPDGGTRWLHWSMYPWRDELGDIGGIVIQTEDISPRKLAELALRESEERYRRLVETTPDATFVHQDRRLVYANPATLRLFGASDPSELLGRLAWDFLDPSVHAATQERMARADRGESIPPRTPSKVRTLQGAVREVEVSAAPTIFGGKPAVQVVMHDVSDERRAARLTHEHEARLDAIVSSATDAIISADRQRRIVLANPAAESLFGYPPGALIGKPLDALVPERLRGAHAEAMASFGAEPRKHRRMGGSAIVGLRADGDEIPLEASIANVEVDGEPLYTVVLRDQRPRLAAERAVRESEDRFRDIAEHIDEVFVLRTVGGQVLYVSPGVERIYGVRAADVFTDVGLVLRVVHPEDLPRVQAAMRGTNVGIEYRIVRDGATRWIASRQTPIRDASGAIVRVAVTLTDITERRSLEEQVRQTQKLESIGRLAGGVAHDFNNLLTIISSSVELVQGEPGTSEPVLVLAKEVADAANRGASLTRQLLAFSRKEIVEPRALDLGDVVGEAHKLLSRLLGEDILIRTRRTGAARVRVDAGQWHQVLLNLAVNARDAMPRGGELSIETGALVVDAADPGFAGVPPGRYAFLRVGDSGTGMTPEVRAHIFEPFFTTKGRHDGTGLGLAVVYGVVKQAQGFIDVSSEVGVGTVFTLLVPEHTTEVTRAASQLPAGAKGGHELVLVVEDEPALRRIAKRILERAGYRVLVAGDGLDALRVLEAAPAPPDLVITDVVMPNLDGPSLATRVHARWPTMKVLYTTGYIADTTSHDEILRDAVLRKPYTQTSLLARVREVLDQARPSG